MPPSSKTSGYFIRHSDRGRSGKIHYYSNHMKVKTPPWTRDIRFATIFKKKSTAEAQVKRLMKYYPSAKKSNYEIFKHSPKK